MARGEVVRRRLYELTEEMNDLLRRFEHAFAERFADLSSGQSIAVGACLRIVFDPTLRRIIVVNNGQPSRSLLSCSREWRAIALTSLIDLWRVCEAASTDRPGIHPESLPDRPGKP